ncbi:MAG: hypothetical protein ACREA9_11350 [Pyrinomonadaceae bacterium]
MTTKKRPADRNSRSVLEGRIARRRAALAAASVPFGFRSPAISSHFHGSALEVTWSDDDPISRVPHRFT